MDRKRLVLMMTLSMALFMGWFLLMNWIETTWPKKAAPPPAGPVASAPGTQPVGLPQASTSASTSPSNAQLAVNPQAARELHVLSTPAGDAPLAVNLGSEKREDPTYAMLLKTTPIGAAVEGVVLNDFLRSVQTKLRDPYVFQEAPAAMVEQFGRPLAMRSITVKGLL